MPELQLLYKRAGVLGTVWSGNSNLKKTAASNNGCRNCANEMKLFNRLISENTESSMYAKLNSKMSPEQFPVTRFGLWLLLGDCENSLRHVSTAYYDRKWRKFFLFVARYNYDNVRSEGCNAHLFPKIPHRPFAFRSRSVRLKLFISGRQL